MLARNSSPDQGSERLAARRKLYRRRVTFALGILALVFIGVVIWGLWRPAVRISKVEVFGADQSYADYARTVMSGTYLGIIPRDSVFFVPEHDIRAHILGTDPRLASVSIFHQGFTGISIRITPRTAVGRWCGLAPTAGVEEYCYVFDASGFVFAAASTSDQTVVPFKLYDPLVGDTEEPLQATLAHAELLPSTFDFARGVTGLGAPVERIVIRGDEVDHLLASGTRITYVLGSEKDAFTALTSAKDNLNLADGSVEYIDLRFPGKVYLKRKETK